ncbi:hypothetical protein [Streptomyces flaveolus]|uniref:hypothetical protein n=1 Tax=Streptomyces flaveolus TaxID=67297 RepID=UPI0016700F41|nr:hypothetical protein [Streptomyces flaveolus]GGQ80258.1 hypothetical protein GCM10010216_47580 [Streptomyces flaveolus]
MAVEELPGRVREFAHYLTGLVARLDPDTGWCAVFRQRDPDGMRACLDGREVPPWDVVEALLQDLAGRYGAAAETETAAARALHAAALTAYDALPGARDALGDRLDVMLREQRYAAERQAELGRLLAEAVTPEAADALRLDLAWARDDHARATARCAEIRARTAELDRAAGRDRRVRRGRGEADAGPPAYGGSARSAADPDSPVPVSAEPAHPETEQPRRRRGGARFAGLPDEDRAPVAAVPAHLPDPVAAPAARTPGGARFAGATAAAEPVPTPTVPTAQDDRAAVARVVEALARLRAEGRSGEAHALLAEAAHGPAVRFPLLAERLDRAGLGADRTTLLWEAASLPAARLVAAADALTAAGRAADGEQVLRQGVVRPAAEIGHCLLGLTAEGRHREARALLDACVRARTPQQAARVAEPAPAVLVPLLLDAARAVSEERHWDLVHALRVAGLAG